MVGYLSEIGYAMIDPLTSVWNSFVEGFPGFIGAIIVLIVGYIVGWAVGHLLEGILRKVGLDDWAARMKIDESIGRITLSKFFGVLAKWYIVIVFLGAAVTLLKMGVLSYMLTKFAQWLPDLIVGLLIVMFGLVMSKLAAELILKTKLKGIALVSDVVYLLILVFMAILALRQIGLDMRIAETTFTILLSAIAIAFALAVGISFGYALKDEAKDVIKSLKKKI